MFSRHYILALLILLIGYKDLDAQRRLTFVSYNVENLFDTIPSLHWDDREYLPASTKAWTSMRFKRKCKQLAEVISYVSEWEIPALIALQEVESELALEELTHHTILQGGNYKALCSRGSDLRGSHVALLYDADQFAVEEVEEWSLHIGADSIYPTRNLLYVSGRLPSSELLDLIVCHLPSRRGGTAAEVARTAIIDMLRMRTDSLLLANPQRGIIVVGDFNATPEDSLTNKWALPYSIYLAASKDVSLSPYCSDHSIKGMLDNSQTCGTPFLCGGYMIDLTPPLTAERQDLMPPGSYYYKGYWERIDRIFVSSNLLHETGQSHIDPESIRIALPPKQYMYESPSPWGLPRRTYGGDHYLGGPSDHLPLVGTLTM